MTPPAGRASRGPSTRLGAVVLVAGLVSAVALVVASTFVVTDDGGEGEAALKRAAADVARVVEQRFDGVLSGRVPASAVFTGIDRDPQRTSLDDAAPERPAPGASPAFDALLAEARVEQRRGNLAPARQLAAEALAKPVDGVRRGAALLASIRMALAAGDSSAVLDLARRARQELTGREADEEGYSLKLLCHLAAAPALGDEGAGELIDQWAVGELALPGEPARLVDGPDGPVLVEDPRRVALRRRLGGGEPPARLIHRALRRAAADALGSLPDAGRSRRLLEVPGGWMSWVRDDAPGRLDEARLTGRGDLDRALQERLPPGVVPEGFVVDADTALGPRDGDGEEVWPRSILLAHAGEGMHGGYGFTVRHVDPAAFMQAEVRDRQLVQGALWVAALFAVGASLATFRALRREARLARLKSEFVAGVSHELRTPVASIQLLAENLEAGRVTDEAGRARYHGLIRRESRRLGRLVNDVLDFARLDRGEGPRLQPEPVDGEDWAMELVDDAQAVASRLGAALEVRVRDVPLEPTLDADALRRAALNLIDNAARHGRPGGEGAASITLEVETRDGDLVVRVADHGPGVPSGRRGAVLRPFVTGGEGTGLGLALVAAIAEGHGGALTLGDRGDGGNGLVAELRVPVETDMSRGSGAGP